MIFFHFFEKRGETEKKKIQKRGSWILKRGFDEKNPMKRMLFEGPWERILKKIKKISKKGLQFEKKYDIIGEVTSQGPLVKRSRR